MVYRVGSTGDGWHRRGSSGLMGTFGAEVWHDVEWVLDLKVRGIIISRDK